jgi:two-component system, OmpR family, response regulator
LWTNRNESDMATDIKQCIFLVDDEPIQNEMLKDYLSDKFDFDIRTFDNGEEALKNMHLKPSYVVLDFHLNAHLPDAQNGVDVLKMLKEADPTVQVIMLSGQDKLEVAVDSMKYGAYDYVIKGETAFSRIENVLNNLQEYTNIKQANHTYKNVIIFLSVVILAIIAASIIMVKKMGS